MLFAFLDKMYSFLPFLIIVISTAGLFEVEVIILYIALRVIN